MMSIKRVAVFVTVLASLCTCANRKATGIEDLAAYVADEAHGLRKQQTWRGITLSVDYTPKAVVVRDILRASYTKERADSLIASLAEYTYFKLTLSNDGRAVTNVFADDADRYVEAEEYLESNIGADISLIVGGNAYVVEDFIYVGGRESARGSVVVVVFKAVPEKQDFQFVFEDRLFGTGMNVFEFRGDSVAMVE